jgi:hypothetical protein
MSTFRFKGPVAYASCGAALAAVLLAGGGNAGEASTVRCRLNSFKTTCTTSPAPAGGFKIQFNGGDRPFYVFTPAGPPTTLNRPMKDAQGRVWLMTGNSSFILKEKGGFGNVIEVTTP